MGENFEVNSMNYIFSLCETKLQITHLRALTSIDRLSKTILQKGIVSSVNLSEFWIS